jgi:diamine N-acetyltransferase
MYTLENENIVLRALEPEDLDILFDIENDKSLWQISNTLAPYSRDLLKKYIEGSHKDIYEARQLRLAISPVRSTDLIGLIDLFEFEPQHNRAGVGILVRENFQGKGIASQALELVLDYAFNQLDLHQVFAHIPANNNQSRRLFEKMGFKRSGTQKDWIRSNNEFLDVDLYQFINSERK